VGRTEGGWRPVARDGLGFAGLDLPGARLRYTHRGGGVSEGPFASLNLGYGVGDLPARVTENRRRVFAALGRPPAGAASARQVHGAATATAAPTGAFVPPEHLAPADVLVTEDAALTLCLTFADCVPILVVDPAAGVLALAHAGWRGMALGAVEAAVGAVLARGGQKDRLRAAVGPCIGPAYTLDPAARGALLAGRPWGGPAVSAAGVDLARLGARILEQAGVNARAIAVAPERTDDARRHFSHRREGGKTGRALALAWLAP
jgi:YfiH family protein